jgi:hypothetical protein
MREEAGCCGHYGGPAFEDSCDRSFHIVIVLKGPFDEFREFIILKRFPPGRFRHTIG